MTGTLSLTATFAPTEWFRPNDASPHKGVRIASGGSSIASDVVRKGELPETGPLPQPWLEAVPQLLKGLFAHAVAIAEFEPERALPSELVANQINSWLASLAAKCPELPEPEFVSTPDGEIQLSWSNAGAHFVVTSQSVWKAKARYEDLTTRKVERATLEWGDCGSAFPLVEKLVRGFA